GVAGRQPEAPRRNHTMMIGNTRSRAKRKPVVGGPDWCLEAAALNLHRLTRYFILADNDIYRDLLVVNARLGSPFTRESVAQLSPAGGVLAECRWAARWEVANHAAC